MGLTDEQQKQMDQSIYVYLKENGNKKAAKKFKKEAKVSTDSIENAPNLLDVWNHEAESKESDSGQCS
jgi:hypothetical protein